MKSTVFLGILVTILRLASPAEAQDPCERQSLCCNSGKDAKPWIGLAKGIRWEASVPEAMARAKKEGKPVLLHQLVGDLDREGC